MKIKGLIFKKNFPVTYSVYSVPILKDVDQDIMVLNVITILMNACQVKVVTLATMEADVLMESIVTSVIVDQVLRVLTVR